MENTDIPQFRTYRGKIELEGVVIQVDIFVDNEMLEDRNSFLISFLCKSNTIYETHIWLPPVLSGFHRLTSYRRPICLYQSVSL